MFEDDKHIDDFLQSRNDFSLPTPNINPKESYQNQEQIPKTELPFSANINQFEHIFKAEIVDNTEQKDLKVLQCKNDTIPRGLTPLEKLFDFNDVAKEPRMEPIETNI